MPDCPWIVPPISRKYVMPSFILARLTLSRLLLNFRPCVLHFFLLVHMIRHCLLSNCRPWVFFLLWAICYSNPICHLPLAECMSFHSRSSCILNLSCSAPLSVSTSSLPPILAIMWPHCTALCFQLVCAFFLPWPDLL